MDRRRPSNSVRFSRLGYLPLVLFVAVPGFASDCSIDSPDIDRGQRKPFFICDESITPEYELSGLAEANITLGYDQYVKRCGMDDKRHGIFFWLQADSDAKTTSIGVRNAQGDELCL